MTEKENESPCCGNCYWLEKEYVDGYVDCANPDSWSMEVRSCDVCELHEFRNKNEKGGEECRR